MSHPEAGRQPCILAVDHGTSGVRTALVTTHGRVLGYEQAYTPITYLEGGGAEQDPDDWWRAIVTTTHALLARGIAPREDIIALSVSSTFSTTVAVDGEGIPLMRALTWLDSRGAPYVKSIMGGFPSLMGYNLIQMWRWIEKTAGGPSLSGKDDIAHVLYIKNELPHVYEKTRAFLGSKDYLNFRLTGECRASFDAMSLFWVLDIRDIYHPRYDGALINELGIDGEKLPPLSPSTAVLGEVKPGVAEELGLPPHVKVVVSSPDHQCACVGSGAVRDFEGHLYIGTSSWVQCVVPFKKTDVFHSIATLPTCIPGRYYTANEQDFAGGCLAFLAENVLFADSRIANRPEGDVYATLDEIASESPAGSDRVLFAPWLNGERTPVDDPSARGIIFNLSKTTRIPHIVRAVLEGVAYNTRWSERYVEDFIGRRMEPLNMVGGGAKSAIWCRIFADVLDREVRQVDCPEMANARGAAFLASIGLGHITFEDIHRLMEYTATFSPRPSHRALYNVLYADYLELYRRSKGLFRRLNGDGR